MSLDSQLELNNVRVVLSLAFKSYARACQKKSITIKKAVGGLIYLPTVQFTINGSNVV